MKSYEKFISKEEIKKIHENSLRIMEEVGVVFENERAREIFKDAGAVIEDTLVKIPAKLVEDALRTVPSSFRLHSTIHGDVVLGDGSKDKIITSNCSNVYIEDSGKIRHATNEDTVKQFIMSETSPITTTAHWNDFPDKSEFNKEQKIMGVGAMTLKYSSKYAFSVGANVRGLDKEEADHYRMKGLEMSMNFQGITEKDLPISIIGINALSPLAYDEAPIENLIFGVQHNLPIWIAPCAMPMMTAPPSVAGLMSTTNAEVLAGLTLTQLIKPGHPFLYGNVSGSTDMRKVQLAMGSPETALIAYATAGLADLYHLPFRVGGGLSDCKDLDAQAGAESMMTIYATLDTGADYVMHMAGSMGAYNVGSLEKFLVDEEIIGMVNRWLKGVRVDDETLRFDEIKKVGPRGAFFYGRTPKIYREEVYLTKLFNKEDASTWQNAGAKSIKAAAHEMVEERLTSYQAPVLTKEQTDAIASYLPPMYRDHI